jgi:hypothetical protein
MKVAAMNSSARLLIAAAALMFIGCEEGQVAADAGPRQTEWSVHGRPGETPLIVADSIPLNQLCANLEESLCDYQIRCDPTANYQRIETCKRDERLPIFNCLARWQYPIEERLASGTLSYHGDRVSTCLRALRLEECVSFSEVPECDFDRFVEGNGILGACCYDSSECQSGYCGDRGPNPEASTRGRCRAKLGDGSGRCFFDSECDDGLRCSGGLCARPLAAAENCRIGATPCAAGLFCVGPIGATTCQASTPIGMRCALSGSSFPPCSRGLGCAHPDGDPFGICIALTGLGEACDESISCSPGLRCSVPDLSDVARCTVMRYGGGGEPCQAGFGVLRCNTRNHCQVEPGSRDGVCASYADLGGDCDGRLACRRGWCRPPDCDDLSALCRLGREGVCVSFQSFDAVCTTTAQCGPDEGGRFCSSEGICAGAQTAVCE